MRKRSHASWRDLGRAELAASALALLAPVVLAPTVLGCGGTLYAVSSLGASSKLEQAQALGAERYAPYEYTFAQEHLRKAAEEAAMADYGDAIKLSDTAEEYAEKAIKLTKQAVEGAGR
jgi:hypothetical protein